MPSGMVAGAVGAVLSCVPFYLSAIPPMTDAPAHVLVARIVADYGDPSLRFSEYFTIDWTPAPITLFYLLLVKLQQLVGPFWDSRIYVSIYVVLTWLSVYYLARAQRRRDPWLAAIVALPIVFSWYTFTGLLPFLMSIPLFALVMGVWVDDWRAAVKFPLLAVMLVLLYGFHIVGAAAAVAVILLGALTQAVVGRERRELVWACLSVCPVAILTAAYLLGQNGPRARLGYRDVLSQVVDAVKFTCASLDGAGVLLMLLWLGALGLVFVYRWRDVAGSRSTVAGAVMLLVFSVALPQTLGALWPAGPRVLPFALVLLVSTVHWAEIRRVPVVTCGLALLACLSLVTSRRALEVDRGYRDAIGAAEIMQPGRRFLPIMTDMTLGSRWTRPYGHIGAIFPVMRGGVYPYVYAAPHIQTAYSPVNYRQSSDTSDYAFMYRDSVAAADYEGVAERYDYVLLWGTSEPIAAVLGEEMSRVYQRGYATLFARRDIAPAGHGATGSASAPAR